MFNYFIKAFDIYKVVFAGRARRSEFWYFTLVNFLIYIILFSIFGSSLVGMMSATKSGDPTAALAFMGAGFFVPYFILIIYVMIAFLPSLTLAARRLHDSGKSAWFLLLHLIPFLGHIILIILFCLDSQEGENKWGPNPKGIGNTSDDGNLIDEIGQ